jgi:uncharacterized membrane protein
MKISHRSVLITIILFTFITAAVVLLTTGLPRIVLGSLLVLIIPGYTLLSVLFPGKDKLNYFERFILCFGLSFALIAFTGVIFSFTPWGIRVIPIIITLVAFTFITAIMGLYRQRRIPEAERITLTIFPSSFHSTGTMRNNIWLYILIALLIVFIGWVTFTVATSTKDDIYTEFYILNSRGEAQDYPRQLTLGEPVNFIVGIINHENEAMNYQVKITVDSTFVDEVTTGIILHLDKWESAISFTPESCGNNQKVEIWLYLNSQTEPYQKESLYFFIDVLCP